MLGAVAVAEPVHRHTLGVMPVFLVILLGVRVDAIASPPLLPVVSRANETA